jgi:hypothetical protein
MKTLKNQSTAQQNYNSNLDECKILLARLEQGITDHAAKAKQSPANFGYAGDVARLKAVLREALFTIGAMNVDEVEKYGM